MTLPLEKRWKIASINNEWKMCRVEGEEITVRNLTWFEKLTLWFRI